MPASAPRAILPHGGALVDRIAPAEARDGLAASAAALPRITLDARAASDLEIIATGAASPLAGFMSRADYDSVVDDMRLASGLPWTIPITLPAGDDEARAAQAAGRAALHGGDGTLLAVMHVRDAYRRDLQREAVRVYGTDDSAHPGVSALMAEPPTVLGGDIDVVALPAHTEFADRYLPPAATRAAFAERGWATVVGFQTRNPVHRAHEYLQKAALEMVDGLLLHPLVGQTKGDDVPAAVRMRCYEVLLANYYPASRTLLAVNPASMRYAGPREAVFHALVRKNYGCTHFIVGRDHAGVGSYYGSYDAQRIFDEFQPDEIGIVPLRFEHSFWCRSCEGMASSKTCPHPDDAHIALSGSKVREMLRAGIAPPPEFSRPEVAAVLIEAMREA